MTTPKRTRGAQPGHTRVGGRNGNRTTSISANIEPADEAWLKECASATGKPVSEIVWCLIRDARGIVATDKET